MFWHDGLGFRPVEREDIEHIRCIRNDPSTWIYLTDVTQINERQQERWFEGLLDDHTRLYFSIVEETKDFPISVEGDFCGFIRMDQIDMNNRSVRVGLDIVPEKRGKGLGTRAFRALLKFCFDHWNMHRLWLCVLEDNEVALRLYRRIGFHEEGRLRKSVFRDGRWKDYIVMSILKDEYRE